MITDIRLAENLAASGSKEHDAFQSSAHLFLNSTSYLSRAGPRACCLKQKFSKGILDEKQTCRPEELVGLDYCALWWCNGMATMSSKLNDFQEEV